MKHFASCIIGALTLLAAAPVFADCAADATVKDVREAFFRGEQKEKAGDARGALGAYVAAQEYTCDPNPVAGEAARRAAAVARPLGDAARARGDHAAAFDIYERGGHFAAADRELLARLEASPDDAALYGEALRHAQYRALPAFHENEKLRIQAAGPYALDAALVKALAAMPLRAADRALAAEAASFDESWYAQYVALIGARPEDPTDFTALQQYSDRMQAFHAANPKDPLREPLEALGRLRAWEGQVTDPAIGEQLARRRAGRAEARAALLIQKHASAPRLLELAIDYLAYAAGDSSTREPRVQKVRRQAESLGDAALAAKRYQLAVEYFDVADARDKQEKARTTQQALAQQQMQPSIAAMQRDAEAMRAQFADPRKIAELQRQAQEAQRALQSGQKERKAQSADSADALAAELGM